MKTFCLLLLFHTILVAHTREFMLQVVDANGNPISKSVKLYQTSDIQNPYRSANSSSNWNWTAPEANVACDIGDSNTENPSWAPIENGEYRLRIDNRYVELTIEPTPVGSGADFNIRYQNGSFIIVLNSGRISMSETRDWDFDLTVYQRLDGGYGS